MNLNGLGLQTREGGQNITHWKPQSCLLVYCYSFKTKVK